MSMEDAVRKAAEAVEGVDLAAVELAATYAAHIDEGGDVEKTGPLLLAALESLLMTPRSRAVTVKGGDRDGKSDNPLDQLRAKRRARVDNAPAVDSPTP
jgi:hypothetical protein